MIPWLACHQRGTVAGNEARRRLNWIIYSRCDPAGYLRTFARMRSSGERTAGPAGRAGRAGRIYIYLYIYISIVTARPLSPQEGARSRSPQSRSPQIIIYQKVSETRCDQLEGLCNSRLHVHQVRRKRRLDCTSMARSSSPDALYGRS